MKNSIIIMINSYPRKFIKSYVVDLISAFCLYAISKRFNLYLFIMKKIKRNM
jgi:hypothetical protein